jgi:hypothetical protein
MSFFFFSSVKNDKGLGFEFKNTQYMSNLSIKKKIESYKLTWEEVERIIKK